jgi:hypothetical protein
VGQDCILLAVFQPASSYCVAHSGSADAIDAQDSILPHLGLQAEQNGAAIVRIEEILPHALETLWLLGQI